MQNGHLTRAGEMPALRIFIIYARSLSLELRSHVAVRQNTLFVTQKVWGCLIL